MLRPLGAVSILFLSASQLLAVGRASTAGSKHGLDGTGKAAGATAAFRILDSIIEKMPPERFAKLLDKLGTVKPALGKASTLAGMFWYFQSDFHTWSEGPGRAFSPEVREGMVQEFRVFLKRSAASLQNSRGENLLNGVQSFHEINHTVAGLGDGNPSTAQLLNIIDDVMKDIDAVEASGIFDEYLNDQPLHEKIGEIGQAVLKAEEAERVADHRGKNYESISVFAKGVCGIAVLIGLYPPATPAMFKVILAGGLTDVSASYFADASQEIAHANAETAASFQGMSTNLEDLWNIKLALNHHIATAKSFLEKVRIEVSKVQSALRDAKVDENTLPQKIIDCQRKITNFATYRKYIIVEEMEKVMVLYEKLGHIIESL